MSPSVRLKIEEGRGEEEEGEEEDHKEKWCAPSGKRPQRNERHQASKRSAGGASPWVGAARDGG